MKVKIFLIAVLVILLSVSISQIFSIYPFAEDVFPYYKSGYFKELDAQFQLIADSFVEMKTVSKPVYSWIYLKDIKEKYGVDVKVYDSEGNRKTAPFQKEKNDDKQVLELIHAAHITPYSEIKDTMYYYLYPVPLSGKCLFCHSNLKNSKIAGVLSFQRSYDPFIYYSSERILLFVILSLVILLLLFAVCRWDPGKNIKELFDKS